MLGTVTIQLDSVVMWLMALVGVGILFYFIRRHDRRKLTSVSKRQSEANDLRRRQDTQKNIANRLCNIIRGTPEAAARMSDFGGGIHIEVTLDDLAPPDNLVLGIFVNLVDEEKPNHIWVRYMPSMAGGWFDSSEGQIKTLCDIVEHYLEYSVRLNTSA